MQGKEASTMNDNRRLVLIAIDTSDLAEYAFDWYAAYLHRPDNEILVMHVTDTITDLERARKELDSGEITEATEQFCSQLTELEERYRHKMMGAKITGNVIAVPGKSPGQAIVDAAHSNKAFCVVMGTRGLGRMKRVFLGSVSDFVVQHALVPVIVVRKHGEK